VLFSRCVEKTSKMAAACLLHVLTSLGYDQPGWKYSTVCFWSDGCGQFKSREAMATLVFALHAEVADPTMLRHVSWEFTCPKHGKSVLDGVFGLVSRTLEIEYNKRTHRTVDEITETMQRWALEEQVIDSTKVPFTFCNFMPTTKSDYKWRSFTRLSLRGIMHSFSFHFAFVDPKRRKQLTGSGINYTCCSALEIRNQQV
jgi:hypothetical protein